MQTQPVTQQDQYAQALMWGREPAIINGRDFDDILLHGVRIGASDLFFSTGRRVIANVGADMYPITRQILSKEGMEDIAKRIHGDDAVARLKTGNYVDKALPVRVTHAERHRFRLNISGFSNRDELGISITARTLAGVPKRLSDLHVDQTIFENYKQANGLVVVCGPTGSGKSTLLSGMMAEMLLTTQQGLNILTFEEPIEMEYHSLDIPSNSQILQHEIPRNFQTYPEAIRSAMRRAPDVMLIGESRDSATMAATIEAAETGHACYTTCHADTIPLALQRMVNLFHPAERLTKLSEIVESLRMIVVQKLERKIGGQAERTAIVEYLVFDQEVRDRLRHCETLRETMAVAGNLVEKYGQTMARSAHKKYDQGLIDKDIVAKYEHFGRAALLEDMDDFRSMQ